jgi:hypothetical protein
VLLWLLERLDWTVGFNEDGALRVRIGDPAGHVPHDAILECLGRVELDLRVLLARAARWTLCVWDRAILNGLFDRR